MGSAAHVYDSAKARDQRRGNGSAGPASWSGSYSESVTVEDKEVRVLGEGADVSVEPDGVPILTVKNASRVLEGLRLHSADGSAGNGVRYDLESGTTEPILIRAENQTYDTKGLEARDQRLRERVAALRATLLQDPEAARPLLQQIEQELTQLESGVQVVANMDAIDAAWKQLHESLSVAGEVRGLFGRAGNDVRMEGMRAALAMQAQWFEVYLLWQRDPKAGQEALVRKSKSKEWRTFLEKIQAILTEQDRAGS